MTAGPADHAAVCWHGLMSIKCPCVASHKCNPGHHTL